MYSENIIQDIKLFSKAVLSNQIARFSPKLYIKLTTQTGRGHKKEDTKQISEYLINCFKGYFTQLEIPPEIIESYLHDKTILEYGPGDILGVALLMYAHGAKQIHCVDRFPLEKASDENIEVYRRIINTLSGKQRKRAESVFLKNGDPGSGFNTEKISYMVTENGFSGKINTYDMIISRAVLEHVNDLNVTFKDIKTSLKKDGISIHQVDLKSHNLDRHKPLDFLTWPNLMYKLMYSHKGFPNRWQIDKYKSLYKDHNLKCPKFEPTQKLNTNETNEIRPKLSPYFRHLSDEELSWLGFWMVLKHKT